MSTESMGSLTLALTLLMVGANLLGQLFTRLRQPKVVGEILAGILLGPTLLGKVAPGFAADLFGADKKTRKAVVLGFLYNFGMLMLMFVAGASAKHLLGKENRKATAFILGLGTPLPFLFALLVAPWLPIEQFMGTAGSEQAVILVFACAAAVTSIPVITKIFSDLGILHTRFASLPLGSAVLEDIGLWGVLSIASAIAAASSAAGGGTHLPASASTSPSTPCSSSSPCPSCRPSSASCPGPAGTSSPRNPRSPGWLVFLGYVSLAAALDVTLAFAALLAGFGVMGGMKGTEQRPVPGPGAVDHDVAGPCFVPVYFALIGYRLDLSKTFDPVMLAGSSSAPPSSSSVVGLAAKLAGMNRLDIINLAITQNARAAPASSWPPWPSTPASSTPLLHHPRPHRRAHLAGVRSWLDYVLRRGGRSSPATAGGRRRATLVVHPLRRTHPGPR